MNTPSAALLIAILLAVPLKAGEPLQDNVAKLVSPVSAERRAGETWLAQHGATAIEKLIDRVEQGDDQQRIDAINALTLLVSPWQRGIERGNRHHGQIELFVPERPTGRPVNHPQAKRLRDVLLATLIKSLQHDESQQSAANENRYFLRQRLISVTSIAVAEVADDDAAHSVRRLLEGEKDRTAGVGLMRCLEAIYCLPNHYHPLGICGVGLTPALVREYEAREAAAYEEQTKMLLAWLDKHAQLPIEQRMDAAIRMWSERFKSDPGYYVSRGNNLPILTLSRLGEGAVERLRTQQALHDSLIERGVFEVVIATITGNVDDALVRELILPEYLGDRTHHLIACEIIALANDKDYQDELAAMLRDARYSSLDVALTLATVHRHAAITLLRQQPQSNYIAHCAIAELESWDD